MYVQMYTEKRMNGHTNLSLLYLHHDYKVSMFSEDQFEGYMNTTTTYNSRLSHTHTSIHTEYGPLLYSVPHYICVARIMCLHDILAPGNLSINCLVLHHVIDW